MVGVQQLYKDVCEILEQNPNADKEFEAKLLLDHVLKQKNAYLSSDIVATKEQRDTLTALAEKRKGGYPLQYILGSWQFFDLELQVGEGVLIPRADTETVCEEAFKIIKTIPAANVLDLCSGSGAIALSIKKYCPDSIVLALEKSPPAYDYLVKNIKATDLCVLPILADVFWFDENIEDDSFDVIIANPPYINPKIKEDLQKEVTFEPEMALFAADNGIRFYKHICEYYRDKIKEKGYLIFEYGFDQKEAVKSIAYDFGYKIIKEIVDLSGNPRGVITQK